MILVSFPRCNENVKALVRGLYERDLLESLHTTLHFEPAEFLVKLVPPKQRKELLRRSFGIPTRKSVTYPGLEVLRLALRHFSFNPGGWHSRTGIDATCHALDDAVAQYLQKHRFRNNISGVYCYEDSALKTFQSARELQIPSYYELTIPYWETVHRITREAIERRPEWACTIRSANEPTEKLIRKTQELEAADVIICISDSVRRSIPAHLDSSKKILSVRYGAPPSATRIGKPLERKMNGRLRVLFAGLMTLRKGLADLFEAMSLLERDDVELLVMGPLMAPMEFYRKHCPNFEYLGRRTRTEVLAIMETCDVFVFPSLCEGQAIVQLEAMSCGLPLISTNNGTGNEVVDEGRTGFLVPIFDPRAIAEKIAWFADNRSAIHDMGLLAQEKMCEWRWESYVNSVVAIVNGGE